jgi:flavin reductase (DIM6/NTAB) family NADH-FMN oxidoreductase RutF
MSLQELQSPGIANDRPRYAKASEGHWSHLDRASVNSAAFRQTLGQLAAGVSIITTRDSEGQLLGMTATAVTSVSLEPPLILVCADHRTRTAAALADHAPFVIQFLAENQELVARQFASFTADKFANVEYRLTASGCPALAGVLASVECMPYAIYPGGDHTIVVGRVVNAEVFDNSLSPLIYVRSHFLNTTGVRS